MININVYVDGENIEIAGIIEPGIVFVPCSLTHSPLVQ